MVFPSQEYSSGLPFSPLGDLPNSGIKPMPPALAGDQLASYRLHWLTTFSCIGFSPPRHQGCPVDNPNCQVLSSCYDSWESLRSTSAAFSPPSHLFNIISHVFNSSHGDWDITDMLTFLFFSLSHWTATLYFKVSVLIITPPLNFPAFWPLSLKY